MQEYSNISLDNLQITIIGLGLIGGSIAKSLQRNNHDNHLIGVVAEQSDMTQALELGLVGECHSQIEPAVATADLIIIATPVSAMGEILATVNRYKKSTAIITDTGSTKISVLTAARQNLTASQLSCFVPGHPIAGSEHNGLTAGQAELFQNKRVLLTPHENTANEALRLVEQLWRALGGIPICMAAKRHDEILAATSHLPHILAYGLVAMLAARGDTEEVFANAAGGLADFTRIASSDAALWRSIVAANRQPVLQALDGCMAQLQEMRQLLAAEQDEDLQDLFTRAQMARNQYMARQE